MPEWNTIRTLGILYPKSEKTLRIIIVGAGIAGLSAGIATCGGPKSIHGRRAGIFKALKLSGHDVIILEQVQEIAEVGAGLQKASNNMPILGRLGVLEEIVEKCSFLERNSLRRWKDDTETVTAPLMPKTADKYGAPLGVIHRGDLQLILLEAAKREDIDIKVEHKVANADPFFETRVQLASGEWIEGDVIIAAD